MRYDNYGLTPGGDRSISAKIIFYASILSRSWGLRPRHSHSERGNADGDSIDLIIQTLLFAHGK